MKLTLRYSDGGVSRSMDLLLTSVKDLDPILRRFGAYLRAEAKGHFQQQGPGWQPLAPSTKERLEHTRTSYVTAAGKIRTSYQRNLSAQLRQQVRSGKIKREALSQLSRLSKSTATRESVEATGSRALVRLQRKLEKVQGQSLKKRRGGKRAIAKHRLLGKLASSLGASVSKGTLTVASKVKWSAIQNEGGQAGHGADLPARTFLELTHSNVAALVEISQEYLLEQAFGVTGTKKR